MAGKLPKTAGAKRRGEARPWRERLAWLQRSLSLLMLSGLLVGSGWGAWLVFKKVDAPIGVILVRGQYTQVDQAQIQKMVEPLLSGGFISLDLQRIRDGLERHPWIEEASISRQWPDSVVIRLVEEVPIARWGDTAFLNHRGERLEIGDNSMLSHLPVLEGVERSERQMMRSYRQMVQMLQPAELRIAALKRDARDAWRLTLTNDLELVIGRDQIIEKMRRFLLVWDQHLRSRAAEVDRVDIRYDNGVAVQWIEKPAQQAQLKQQQLSMASGEPEQV
ncbi:cell division protein FtsQ/DivIB [Porticoccus sp.]|uniref:cell division protein FtsQ/DivIB n=1 Tax=Porticoccus sp. TaxID=2024853 RepID=UPI000C62E246|nr:cell division protein FtsQ/DivIB [Porticoccus sp.]MAZ69030.1 cell division protein FtsQ [Porticoccus sp.]|tara:strand:+ start:14386 stop:15216 length:831 start_codon:yes stop_codon:yes gene_type:complete